jgi:hypothetical protein
MEKSICLNCGAAFDQTPGKREKKFCKPSCRVSYCQKRKRLDSKINFQPATEDSFKGSLSRAVMDEAGAMGDSFDNLNIDNKKKPVKKAFKVPTDKHGAGKIVKEAVQKKEVTIKEVVSSYLDQRRKQKLGK